MTSWWAALNQAHAQVRQLLGEHKAALERLAHRLLDHEVLEGAELQSLLTVQAGASVAVFSPRTTPPGQSGVLSNDDRHELASRGSVGAEVRPCIQHTRST